MLIQCQHGVGSASPQDVHSASSDMLAAMPWMVMVPR